MRVLLNEGDMDLTQLGLKKLKYVDNDFAWFDEAKGDDYDPATQKLDALRQFYKVWNLNILMCQDKGLDTSEYDGVSDLILAKVNENGGLEEEDPALDNTEAPRVEE